MWLTWSDNCACPASCVRRQMATLERERDEECQETRTPDRDALFSVVPESTEPDPASSGKNEARVRQHETKQLQQQHLGETQQLYEEQLDQLKAFKAQLVQDVLTQMSPRPASQLGTPCLQGPPVITSGSPEVSLSLGEAGRLLYPLTSRPPRHSPLRLTAPVRPALSSKGVIRPLPLPHPPYSAPSTPRPTCIPVPDVSMLQTPDNAPANMPQCTLTRPPLDEGSLYSMPPLPSPSLSPQLHDPSSHHVSYSPNTTTNPTIYTHTFKPIPVPDTNTNPFQTPPRAWKRPQHSTQHTPSPSTSTSCPVATHHLQSQGVSLTDTESAVKAVLIEKHAKHVEDLKCYYESQLAKLQESLQVEKLPSQIPSNSTCGKSPVNRSDTSLSPAPYHSSRVHSPTLATVSAARLQTENDRLNTKCADLESKLQQSSLAKQTLEAQVAKQQQCLLEWQSQAETSSQTIAVLQDRLKSSRTQLQQQDSIVEQLQADLQVSVGEIQFWKDQRTQEAEKFKQLYVEIEELQQQNESLEAMQRSLREELSTARREVGRLDAALKTSTTQEHTLKSTIHKLEDRIRHLEHVNNRLHSQATHYTLGSPFPNTPDDDKLQRHSPTSSPLNTPPPRRTVTSHTHPHTTPPSTHHLQAEVTKSVPLSRRKWLQPSDPGLILGAPQPPSNPHTHHHTSNTTSSEMTSSPLLQSTGQTLVRQTSDSGSSNEGEDPASLTRQSYINRDSGTGSAGADDSLIVNSALSAIHSGKIRTDTPGQPPRQQQQKESMQERVRRSLREVSEAEQRLAELHREKDNLESVLQRSPRHITRQNKLAKLQTEQRLEEVIREIGSVKMTLRSYHALRK